MKRISRLFLAFMVFIAITAKAGASNYKNENLRSNPGFVESASAMQSFVSGILVTYVGITTPAFVNTINSDNGTLQMSAQAFPANATIPAVKWSVTSGSGAATISANGLLTARLNGTVTVTAASTDGSLISDSKQILISNQVVTELEAKLYPDSVNQLTDGGFNTEGPVAVAPGAGEPWVIWSENGGTANVTGGVCKIAPVDLGINYSMFMSQGGWVAYNDTSYILTFTAWADENRSFKISLEDPANVEAQLGSSTDPGTINGRTEWIIDLTPTPKTFVLHCTMDAVLGNSEFNLVLWLKGSAAMYLDNIFLVAESDVPANLNVTRPVKGNFWISNLPQDIEWISAGWKDSVNIEFSANGSAPWEVIASDIISLNGYNSYSWTVAGYAGVSENAAIRVISKDLKVAGVSDVFSFGELFSGGTGTIADPFLIGNADNLDAVRKFLGTENSDKYFRQISDIDLSAYSTGKGWKPIGDTVSHFYGHYDGNNFTISGLTINRPGENYIGLFGWASHAWLIKIGLVNVSITGNERVAALAGKIDGTSNIEDCYSSGTVKGKIFTAGLFGNLYGSSTVYQSYSSVNVIMLESPTNQQAGGLVGRASHDSRILNSFATGKVEGMGFHTGGLVGFVSDQAFISNCYSTGNITGDYAVGGLVGSITGGYLIHCYSAGNVSYNYSGGGLTGWADAAIAVQTNCYWNTESSGQGFSDLGEGKITYEMLYLSTYVDWDFFSTYSISEGITYPYLLWQGVSGNSNFPPSLFPPSELSASLDNGTVLLTWSKPIIGAVTGYQVYRDDILIGTVTSLNYIDSGLTDLTEYRYKIIALSATEESAPSNITSVYYQPWFSGGDGTESNPFTIATAEQLDNVRIGVGIENSEVYFLQTANIDLGTAPWNQGEGWEPIGNPGSHFYGNYNGNGYSISGLTINRPGSLYQGLFGWTSGANLVNLGLLNVDITGSARVAAVAARVDDSGYMGNCYSTGKLAGERFTGGLVANLYNGSTVENCYSSVNIRMVPGINGNSQAGGLVARIHTNSHVLSSYATGKLDGTGSSIGGLTGYMSDNSSIANCYSAGEITGDYFTGGLIGSISNSSVSNSYSAGKVNSPDFYGGLVGYIWDDAVTVTNSYWNNETSGMVNSAGGTGKNTMQMLKGSTYLGWDYSNIWNIRDGLTYPYLNWQLSEGSYNLAPAIIPPSNLSASSDNASISLAWASPSVGTVTAYNVYRNGDLIGSVSALNYTDTGITDQGTYNYFVTALYNLDESGPSNIVFSFTQSGFSGGSGSEEDPYLVSTAGELNTVRLHLSSHFRQVADIDLGTAPWNTGEGWEPVGSFTDPFMGNYNGDGFSISNLTINRPQKEGVGLFSSTWEAFIYSLTLENVNITGLSSVGALTGDANYSIHAYISVEGNISGRDNLGGILGNNIGSYLLGSHSGGTITGSRNNVGGLAGVNIDSSLISECFSDMEITAAWENAGGLAAVNGTQSFIENSYFVGSVAGGSAVGGIAGLNDNSFVLNCYSTGLVTSAGNAGGLSGTNNGGIIYNSYWNSETSGQNTSAGGEERITSEMTYPYAGSVFVEWNFTDTWVDDVDFSVNNGYPYLGLKPALGIKAETGGDLSVQIYPNPVTDRATIEYSLSRKQFVEITIFDQVGRKIETLVNSTGDAGNFSVTWETGNLANGLYYLKIAAGDKTVSKKIMISR